MNMKQLFSLIYLASFTARGSPLVGRDRRDDAGVAKDAPNVQVRHKGWKTRSWYDYDYDDKDRFASTRTVTVTVTVTVTQPVDGLPTDGIPVGNATTTVDGGVTATSTVDLAPITLIDIKTLVSSSGPTSGNAAAAPTPNDIPPITLFDVNTLSPTAVASSVDNAAAPTPNNLAPITLIDLKALSSVAARVA
ncbi:uncharacterized protein K460DRAFT_415313 [Cucurbitaria berberidis CBS 394.84]|uniref:Uncharacterized protein n=1 Tax=Cucurbitaria berberidis CBS 394.84 TaxID=1168544 RepID=A0A9P4GP97_9PLEO|nr:uncharacterized protein K460DRAFT_415313 [Cucurbitaria berberidis CBS 394.84]KAF1848832.1 hypothetical protein K460DRAFT_415313 [Cucurbitaria berberidis CBS 394.84]